MPSGLNADQCYQEGSNELVACSSPEAIALSGAGKQDGMRGGVLSYSHVGSYPQEDCVQDNTTGLMWEGKKPAGSGHLRAADQRFTNYHTSYYGTQAQMDAATNTYGYVKAVNASNLCGFNDWRLPTIEELQSIIHYGKQFPSIDMAWLVHSTSWAYQSSSPYAGYASNAWLVGFDMGGSGGNARSTGYAIRLVRGAPAPASTSCPSTPTAERFTYSADDSEVTDKRTGLTWKRCSEGQSWTGTGCSGTATHMTHEEALKHARDQAGWRLPDVKELASLADRGCKNPAIDQAAFPDTPSDKYWPSSPFVSDVNAAWGVNFGNGHGSSSRRDNDNAVRLVRAAISNAGTSACFAFYPPPARAVFL